MKPRVLFVGGYGRSGSTIIDLKLAEVPGIVPVGEFRHLFGRALGDNELCSCGEPFNDCAFWREVLAAGFPDGFDRAAIQGSVAALNRLAAVPALRAPRLRRSAMKQHLGLYGAAFQAAYRGVIDVTGASVIVDSSKYPLHAMSLAATDVVDLSVMLLVRDPRAVAHSWERKRLRPEVHWEERYMPQHNVARSALAWNVSNWLTRGLASAAIDIRVQRYEDFVVDPDGQLESIAEFATGHTASAPRANDVRSHTVAGNPVRLADGPLAIKADAKWTTELSRAKQLVVTALCMPGMRRYGYELAPMSSLPAKTSP